MTRIQNAPAGESDVILVGELQGRRAFLSNDKSGVYTELTIDVVEVLKGGPPQATPGIKRLYLISGEGMPLGSDRYVLFLKSAGLDQHFSVLTTYQLEADTVVPLDHGERLGSVALIEVSLPSSRMLRARRISIPAMRG